MSELLRLVLIAVGVFWIGRALNFYVPYLGTLFAGVFLLYVCMYRD